MWSRKTEETTPFKLEREFKARPRRGEKKKM